MITESDVESVIEKRMLSLVCSYIKKHLKSNIRVNISDEIVKEATLYSLEITMSKDLKRELNNFLKLIPQNIYLERNQI